MHPQNLRSQRFRRTQPPPGGTPSLDGPMLSVLMEWDGQATLDEVGQRLGLPADVLFDITGKLLSMGLIEAVASTGPVLEKELVRRIVSELALAIGPIAEIIVEDTIADLGYEPAHFPRGRAAELVSALAGEIKREERRREFERAMAAALREIGS